MEEEQKHQKLLEKSKLIEMKPVTSSNVGGIGYDSENRLLKVAFKNKDSYTTYLYEDVEPDTYNAIISEGSIGKQLSERIIKQKTRYKYTKL